VLVRGDHRPACLDEEPQLSRIWLRFRIISIPL
jgi:hypothetical protein